MEAVLAGLIPETCLPNIDDVLVMARTFKSPLERLRAAFLRFRNAGLKLKAKKCHLAQSMVRYLGYVVSKKGISADPLQCRNSQIQRTCSRYGPLLAWPRTTRGLFRASLLWLIHCTP